MRGEVTHSKPVHLRMASPDENFYRVVGRSGVTRARRRRRRGIHWMLAVAVSALIWLGGAAIIYAIVY